MQPEPLPGNGGNFLLVNFSQTEGWRNNVLVEVKIRTTSEKKEVLSLYTPNKPVQTQKGFSAAKGR